MTLTPGSLLDLVGRELLTRRSINACLKVSMFLEDYNPASVRNIHFSGGCDVTDISEEP